MVNTQALEDQLTTLKAVVAKLPHVSAPANNAINIDVINSCTVLTDAQVLAALPALQKQIDNDFYPIWGVKATLHFVSTLNPGTTPNPGHWWIAMIDNSDTAGALGYHDLTTAGLPIGKCFVATDLHYGLSWTVTLSHELLEMLVDPYINLSAQMSDTTLYSYEVCDAVEDDQFGYTVDGVLVSDFVTPEWFENMSHVPGTKFDFKGILTAPMELATGGYISVLDFSSTQGWTQLAGRIADPKWAYSYVPKVGSRRERRGRLNRLIRSIV